MSLLNIARIPMVFDSGRGWMAYIWPPNLWHVPSRRELSQWLSTAIEVYYKGLTVLVDSAVRMAGFKDAGSRTVPGGHSLDRTHSLETSEQEVKSSFGYLGNHDIESGAVPVTERESRRAQITSLCIGATSPGANRPCSLPSEVMRALVAKCSQSTDKIDSVTSRKEDLESELCGSAPKISDEVVPIAFPHATLASPVHERIRKYAGMRTLKLPGRQLRAMKAPTESELALRQIDEELAITASQRDEYCARELAGRGIFVHPPTANAQPDGVGCPRVLRRIRRETSVGPSNPSWSAKHARNAPTIHIIRPEDIQPPTTVDRYRSILRSDHDSSPSTEVSARRGRARSNAVYVSCRISITATTSECMSPEKPTTIPVPAVDITQVDAAKGLNRNQTSMSDWLSTISCGNNLLVADDVAVKARSVLCASPVPSFLCTPPLSPTDSASSWDSSAPSTPVDDFFLSPDRVEETEVMGAAKGHSRRARCSYVGDGWGVTYPPMIPEDLVTDEIGVAC